MVTIKKTISLPKELYEEAENLSHNFSEIIREAFFWIYKKEKNRKSSFYCRSL